MVRFNFLASLLALVAWLPGGFTQNDLGTVKDLERIALTPFVSDEPAGVPEAARSILESRVRLLANSNGAAGYSQKPQFILAARPVLLDKKIVGSAPTMIKTDLEISLFMADVLTKTVFSTTTIELSGLGSSDAESYGSAFRQLKTSSKGMATFLKKGREGILTFYNTRCDFILQRVDMLAGMNQYSEALELLVNIPEVCKDCFDKAVQKTPVIYKASIEAQCQSLVQKAKTVWSASPNRTGADRAALFLLLIPADSKCASEAGTLLGQIETKMLETEKWERKQYSDQIELSKLYINAMRDIGVAWGNGQPDQVIHVKGWLW